tara:strand:+ start:1793 stop:2173 length:381 start_codon:yes stop_codon:yes gene_type:complete
MAVIKLKRSETASSVPTTSDIAVGEVCMNLADQKLYTRKSDDSIITVASHSSVGATSVGGDLSGTVSNAQIVANSVGITELNVSDGSNGQVLKTNGSGTLSFTTISAGVSASDAEATSIAMSIALG